MNPVLLDLGMIKIYWYSICIFLGIFIGGVKSCAAGITSAVVFGFLASLFAKPSLK